MSNVRLDQNSSDYVLDTDNYVRGHKPGFESRSLNQMAEQHNMSQHQLDDFMRANTNKFYKLEDKKKNATHEGEDHEPLESGEHKLEIDKMMENHCANLSCGKTE
ncbi:MAG: hypothetical protein HRU38_21760 [Saccharospirillaceae bacterium]|nr:GH-E family nuclease [Pseudomonadales bacterium]NRB81257.1 hypothetical protein [Saccharospirillaceae bacterium]